jgi:hypothetical protein
MRINPVGWLLFVFFLGGGVWFTVAMPEIWIGQIWVVVSFVMIAGLWLLGRPAAKAEKLRREGIRGQASVLEATQTGTQINRQPVLKLRLRISAPGVTPFEVEKREIVPLIALGRLTSGFPVTAYVDRADHSRFALDWSGAPAPAGTVDLRQRPDLREAVTEALRHSGVVVPGSSATDAGEERDPATRIQKLTEPRHPAWSAMPSTTSRRRGSCARSDPRRCLGIPATDDDARRDPRISTSPYRGGRPAPRSRRSDDRPRPSRREL